MECSEWPHHKNIVTYVPVLSTFLVTKNLHLWPNMTLYDLDTSHKVSDIIFVWFNWDEVLVRHCSLVESACTWDGTGCEFDSWQCRIYISHVHWAYDYLGPFGVLWVHMAWHKNCVEKKVSCASSGPWLLDRDSMRKASDLLLYVVENVEFGITIPGWPNWSIPKLICRTIIKTSFI